MTAKQSVTTGDTNPITTAALIPMKHGALPRFCRAVQPGRCPPVAAGSIFLIMHTNTLEMHYPAPVINSWGFKCWHLTITCFFLPDFFSPPPPAAWRQSHPNAFCLFSFIFHIMKHFSSWHRGSASTLGALWLQIDVFPTRSWDPLSVSFDRTLNNVRPYFITRLFWVNTQTSMHLGLDYCRWIETRFCRAAP